MKLLEWFKKLNYLVETTSLNFQSHARLTNELRSRIDTIEKVIKERTSIDIDVGIYDSSTVLVSGQYGGVDYVNVFSVGKADFTEVVKMLKHMERYGNVRRIDAPRMQAAFIRDSLKNTY